MEERPVDRQRAVVAHHQSSEVAEPSDGAFHGPPSLIASQRPAVLGLYNDLVGFLGGRLDAVFGKNVFHVGDSLGLGGLLLRRKGEVYRPPINVSEYFHKPSPLEVPQYRFLTEGPIRAIIEARMDHWRVGDDEVALRALYSIDAGDPLVRCRFSIVPIRLAANHSCYVGVGMRGPIHIEAVNDGHEAAPTLGTGPTPHAGSDTTAATPRLVAIINTVLRWDDPELWSVDRLLPPFRASHADAIIKLYPRVRSGELVLFGPATTQPISTSWLSRGSPLLPGSRVSSGMATSEAKHDRVRAFQT